MSFRNRFQLLEKPSSSIPATCHIMLSCLSLPGSTGRTPVLATHARVDIFYFLLFLFHKRAVLEMRGYV